MSTFQVLIKRIYAVEKHPNADRLDIARVDGYEFIVGRRMHYVGDLAAYIPERAIVPEWVLKRLRLWDEEKQKGMLAGPSGDRVKAIKLRGRLSQGICLPIIRETETHGMIETIESGFEFKTLVAEGDDVTDILGIRKYEPPIPVAMSGDVFNAGTDLTVDFDVMDWKRWPDVFSDGEEVIFTEKIHGTFTGIAVLPLEHAHPDAFGKNRNIMIFSKGLGAKGLVFKNNEKNKDNLYVRSTRKLIERLDEVVMHTNLTEPLFILGETYGPGVQDLTYGKELEFRVFAVACRYRGSFYHSWSFVSGSLKNMFDFETVPVLYQGPFSVEKMREFTDGKTTLDANHIREGIVITRAGSFDAGPSAFIKSVSGDYLVREGGTEFN